MMPYCLYFLVTWVAVVWGGGMVIDPINRGSLWRLGYDVSPDYDDELQNCGEVHSDLEIKCGECGDHPGQRRPRDHENTGQYGLGIIVRKYKAGQVIDANVSLTENHQGHFSFDLCPLKDKQELETDECFKSHPVLLEDGSPKYTLEVNKSPGYFLLRLKLPDNLTCEHCVFRWTYRTGKDPGQCPNGIGAFGCGPQEHLRTCSDIAIS